APLGRPGRPAGTAGRAAPASPEAPAGPGPHGDNRKEAMPRLSRPFALPGAALLALGLAACSPSSPDGAGGGSGDWTPVTVEHAFGETTIDTEPERVATVNWANHEVPLALGIVPVGMAAADFGDDDGDGVLPWVEEKLQELDAETPVLFEETDGIDFEAV